MNIEGNDVVCVYHEDCNDGLVAAYCVWEKFPEARFYPAQYKITPIPEVKETDTVIIVDFSFPPEQLKALADNCKFVYVLDHHASAIELLEDFSHPNVEMVLDTSKAGSLLTWEALYTPNEKKDGPPPIVKYANDYDLWTFEYGKDTDAFVRFMYAQPDTFEACKLYGIDCDDDHPRIQHALEIGHILINDDEEKIKWHLENSTRIIRVGEHRFPIPLCNVPRYILSKTMNRLAQDYFFAIGYSEGEGGRKLRFNCSEVSDIDLTEVAGLFGGGGHQRSAGAVVDLNYPWDKFQERISAYIDSLED